MRTSKYWIFELPARNVGEGCWSQCDKKHGKCSDYCGAGGLCCRYGKKGNECDGSIGVDKSHHKCTADQRGINKILNSLQSLI